MPEKNLKKEDPLLDSDLHAEFVNLFKKLEAIQDTTLKQDILRRIIHIVDNPDLDDVAAPKIENTSTSDAPVINKDNIYDILGHVSQDIINDLQAFFTTEMHLQMFGTPKENLEALRSIIPKTAVINNSKLAQNITKEFIGAGDIELIVIPGKKPARIVASLAYDDPTLSIVGRQPFTAYDRAVYNGICSLFQAGNKHFTPAMVYRAMNGITERQYISPQSVGAVTRSIEKLRVTKLRIDCAAQLKAYPNLRQATLDDMLLSAKKVTVINQNGKKEEAYSINTTPILYEYSRQIGQVLSVPPKLLNSSSAIRSTEEIIVIREYLIRRIEGMKGKNALQSKRITYAGVCDELGIDIASLTGNAKKDTHKRIRKNTGALLSHLQHENYIKGYEEYKDGRMVAGVEITL